MGKKKANNSMIKSSNLLFKVSTGLQGLLEKYKIEYTPADISLLRNIVISNLGNVGINQNNYNNKKYEGLKIYTMNLEINKLYKTAHGVLDTPERKIRINNLYSTKQVPSNTPKEERKTHNLEGFSD